MPDRCILSDCPAWQRPVGCGWLSVGVPCQHSQYREAWAAAMAAHEENDQPRAGSLVARAQAASRDLTPEEALALIEQASSV